MPLSVLLDHRKTVRMYDSEFDRATVVSMYPLEILEYKHTIEPGIFHIPPASPEHPKLLIVTGSSWWRDISPDEPMLEVPQPSQLVANSIVNDHNRAMFGFEADKAHPALFWLPGIVTLEELDKKYKAEKEKNIKNQQNWFNNLIREADKLWARTNGNPASIPTISKIAGNFMNVKRAWMEDFSPEEVIKCPACGVLVNPAFPVCANCKTVINKKRAEELKLEFIK